MRYLKIFMMMFIAVFVTACSEEDPSVRVRNDLDVKANVQLKPTAGNTININDVLANTTSAEVTVQEGNWIATASIQSVSSDPTVTFEVQNDYRYTVVIVNADPPVLQVLSEEK